LKLLFTLIGVTLLTLLHAQEERKTNETRTYDQLIKAYKSLAEGYKNAQLSEIGQSDIGKPLHLFVIDTDADFQAKKTEPSKVTILINNGIHPGESCGIDASVELAEKLLSDSAYTPILEQARILIIPVYNVGGMLNRGSFSRANQNGPKAYGFRGNAKNLDLNRDFIKTDSKNAKSFNQFFADWEPDVFVETHTTNGSDHRYTLTLIATQIDKLEPSLANFLQKEFEPELYQKMAAKGQEITPYVYTLEGDPHKGIKAFLETPRYSTGYAALHHCLGFITEAHVFKPYEERVEQTKSFLETLIVESVKQKHAILKARKQAELECLVKDSVSIDWELDTSQFKNILFKGFEKAAKTSELTKLPLSFYDQTKPYEDSIRFYNRYQPTTKIKVPDYYLIPQAYDEVIKRLEWNGVKYERLKKDTLIEVFSEMIVDYQSPKRPYEGHFLHSNIRTQTEKTVLKFYKGDLLVPTKQRKKAYLSHVLEARAVDGFFAWNFFDGILQQKEWFSDYAFEPKAKKLLEENDSIRLTFEKVKEQNPDLTKSNFEQLYFIYKLSPYYEKSVNRFPIYKIHSR
jgi:hypothetical protein